MDRLAEIEKFLPAPFARALGMLGVEARKAVCELRLRSRRPYAAMIEGRPVFFTENSVLSVPAARCLAPEPSDILDTLSRCSEYSLHKSAAQLSRGYITTRSGHRIGVCAAVCSSGAADPSQTSSLNIRVAGEVIGCADELVAATQSEGLSSVLIAGPPLCGKTTLLRDFARVMSDSPRLRRVVIADERGELAAMHEGTSPMRLGVCCDVLDAQDKRGAFEAALRSLSPELIVFDELGDEADFITLERAVARGVKLAASVHTDGSSAKTNPTLKRLAESGAFDYIVTLQADAPGRIIEIERTTQP